MIPSPPPEPSITIMFLQLLPALITALAAVLAIWANVYLQKRTLEENRKNNLETLEQTRKTNLEMQKLNKSTVLSGIVSGNRQKWIDELREDVSKFIPITYDVSREYKRHKAAPHSADNSFPSEEFYDTVLQADLLHNKIILKLNLNEELHKEFERLLNELRDSDHDDLWLDRKDRVMKCASTIFKEEWQRIKKGDL